MSDNVIYKIFWAAEWQAAEGSGEFAGSADDIRDGFIHFSTAEQLRGTLEKYFADEEEIILASFEASALGEALRWEISRGGMKFPHLYAALPVNAALQIKRVLKNNAGEFILPDRLL